MNKLSLAEAVKLKSVLNKRIHEYEEEINRVGFIEVEKGSKITKQTRTLHDVEKELADVRKDFRLLDRLMYKANIENTIPFNNEEMPIVEAIELATQLRAQARKCKELGESTKEEYPYAYTENFTIIRVATFDPEEYRLKAIELERLANRLSNMINSKNYSVEIEFDSEKYF